MKLRELPSRRTLLAFAALALALELAGFATLTHDDAYITFRYGQNLALGRGLVFNPGERVLGFTSPLHTLLASLCHLLVGHELVPRAMAVLGCVAWSAQALLVFRLLERSLGTLPSLACAALLAAGGASSAPFVALETNLAAALALGALLLALGDAWLAAAAVAGLASLARPDALLVAGALGVLGWRRLGWRVWRPAACFCAVTLPWVAFATAYFGSPVPQPLRVKFQRTSLPDYVEHLLRELVAAPLGVTAPTTWLVVLGVALAAFGAWTLVRGEPRLAALVAYGVLHAVAYTFLRPFRAHTWQLYPAVLVFSTCVWVGVASLLTRAGSPIWRVLAGSALVLLFAFYAYRSVKFARTHETAHWFGGRDATYRAAAEYLRAHARPGERVAAPEVGTLGYYSDLPVYDLGGLVTERPRIVERRPRPYTWLAADSHYAWLRFPDVAPVREWSGAFPLRLYVER